MILWCLCVYGVTSLKVFFNTVKCSFCGFFWSYLELNSRQIRFSAWLTLLWQASTARPHSSILYTSDLVLNYDDCKIISSTFENHQCDVTSATKILYVLPGLYAFNVRLVTRPCILWHVTEKVYITPATLAVQSQHTHLCNVLNSFQEMLDLWSRFRQMLQPLN